MPSIVIASINPVKINAVKGAFTRVFPGTDFHFVPHDAPSGVNSQPLSNDECLQGARNRILHCLKQYPQADFWVSIEAGLEIEGDQIASYSWTLIHAPTGKWGKASTGTSYLPPAVAALIRQGKELGEAMDIVFGRQHSKQNNGAVGLLTNDVITRQQIHEGAVVLALIPFIHTDLYPLPER